jgi:hypothetical protein
MKDAKSSEELRSLPKLVADFIERAKKHVNQARGKHKLGDGFDLSTLVATFCVDAATIGSCLEYRFSSNNPESGSDGQESPTGTADENVPGPGPALDSNSLQLFLEDLEPAAFRHHNCRVYLLNLLAFPDLWKTRRVRTCNACKG